MGLAIYIFRFSWCEYLFAWSWHSIFTLFTITFLSFLLTNSKLYKILKIPLNFLHMRIKSYNHLVSPFSSSPCLSTPPLRPTRSSIMANSERRGGRGWSTWWQSRWKYECDGWWQYWTKLVLFLRIKWKFIEESL